MTLPLRVLHIAAFGVAALACLAAVPRVRQFTDTETRIGLTGLLLCSGVWAATHALRLVAPTDGLKISLYMIGLLVGFASVGAWLYFCSAYTGHDYHRRPLFRQSVLALYLSVAGLKLTNPVHSLYFTTTFSTTPFAHLSIDPSPIHWVLTGLAYALTAVGFYMLYETFTESYLDTRLLGGLVGVTAIPVAFDILAYTEVGLFIKFNYEPLGVAVFAVGALFVIDDQFVAVPQFWRNRVIEALDDAVVLITDDRIVRDVNEAAAVTFPELADAVGSPLSEVCPSFAAALDNDEDIIAVEDEVHTRYYLLETSPIGDGPERAGEVLICTDVTEVERQRRELQRQNEQFDDFAEAITHELRNTLSIAQGYLDLVSDGMSVATPIETREACATARESLGRMDRIVADLTTLARYGQTVDSTEFVDPVVVAEIADERLDASGPALTVHGDREVAADESRLIKLFSNCLGFAAATDASELSVDVGPETVEVVCNGEPIPAEHADRAFEYGEAVPNAETGLFLPTIQTLCRVHGWSVCLDSSYPDGVKLVIQNVRTRSGTDADFITPEAQST
ncbi:MAG: histidine kinase N-terminal 7TM domain-containing protein [Halobellus sp.]|uniref:histidine kinase N-terminal 7TM domain-containing protein n=1 Tax=Halobellus sp. TaxID=1979212 RepID=UPI0035D3F515